MRIGLTCTTIESSISKNKIDGIGTYTKNLYERLSNSQHTVIPYSFPNLYKKPISDFKNGKFFPLNYPISTITSFLKPINIAKNIDILHVTDHRLPRIKKTPVIATIHDALMYEVKNTKNWLRKKTIHWADHYITVSNAMVNELINNIGIKQENISVIHNGIADIWFKENSDATKLKVLRKYNLPKQFILCAGTIQKRKNLPTTISAYLQLPKDIKDEFPLVIVGRKGWNTDESMAAIKKLTDTKQGKWLDYIEFNELLALFQSASLYLHASTYEGFGLTILEAFAAKTPVITSNITAMPEVAGNAALLVDPYSTEEIKNAILNILTNNALANELIQKGFHRATQFSWNECSKKTLEVYEKFL